MIDFNNTIKFNSLMDINNYWKGNKTNLKER